MARLVLQAKQNLSYLQNEPDFSLCSQLASCSNSNTFQQSFILFLFHTDLIRFGLFAMRYFISSLFFSWLLLNFSIVLVIRSLGCLLFIVLYYNNLKMLRQRFETKQALLDIFDAMGTGKALLEFYEILQEIERDNP